MTDTTTGASNRIWINLALVAGIAGSVALLPWNKFFAADFKTSGKAMLEQRVAEYVKLRRIEDWKTLYGMTDPVNREKVSEERFLQLYSSGAIRLRNAKTKSLEINEEKKAAKVVFEAEIEIVRERLPPQARRGLRVKNASELIQKTPMDLFWMWRDGNWYYSMDEAALTGRDPARGESITPIRK